MPVKKKAQQTPSRGTAIWIIIMFLFIGELFFYTWCRVQFTRVGYEITQASRNQQSLLALQKNLKIELARLKSPERLSRLAEKLQLTTPRPEQLIVIR